MPGDLAEVLERLGLRPRTVTVMKDVPAENASWLIESRDGERLALRRYHARATYADLSYEHAVLRHLAQTGWVVPETAGPLIRHGGLWYCPTRFVPGQAVAAETAFQRRRRGRDLADLHIALRGLGERIGQRPDWQAQHTDVTVHTSLDWQACLSALTEASPRLGAWADAAATRTREALARVGADDLPLIVVHGDFAEWNVHYQRGRLAGVIDFGLTHLDSRPYELAIARTYRSPEAVDAYRAWLANHGWPLTELEEAAIVPVYRAFRVDMAAWSMEQGRITGDYDLAMIERQLSRTGTPQP
ncbi:MAG: phosphotransferase [Streptosporangiaceae bacterium]|nr:phosphotransferase [Streptosporangiaceae bacterium]